MGHGEPRKKYRRSEKDLEARKTIALSGAGCKRVPAAFLKNMERGEKV